MFRFAIALAALATLLLMPLATPTTAQDDPDPREIEADINALARRVAINDLRDQAHTRWVGGDLGYEGYRANQQTGFQFSFLRFADFDGNEVRIKDPDRPLLINLWASWCPPCTDEFPMLLDFAQQQSEYVDVVFVNVSDDLERAAAFLATQDMSGVQSYVDEGDVFLQIVGLVAYPTTVLIDTDGTLLMIRTGTVTPTFLAFADLVGGYPGVGQFDASVISDDELLANLDGVDFGNSSRLLSDEVVVGALSHETWYAVYHFDAQAGQRFRAAMDRQLERGSFDPYLVLIGPDGTRVAENDDGDDDVRPNARLDVTLPDDGRYILVATRFLEADGLAEGQYSLVYTLQ